MLPGTQFVYKNARFVVKFRPFGRKPQLRRLIARRRRIEAAMQMPTDVLCRPIADIESVTKLVSG
jgi:hypothetical protein